MGNLAEGAFPCAVCGGTGDLHWMVTHRHALPWWQRVRAWLAGCP